MIPTLDLSPLLSAHQAPASLVQAVDEAARGCGALSIVGHGISEQLINKAYHVSRAFFDWPLSEKMRYYIGAHASHRGYVPVEERGDYQDESARAYEAFDLGHELPADEPDSRSAHRLLGVNQWPALEGFKEIIGAYYQQVAQLSLTICALLERYLGLSPGRLTQHMRRPISQLRLLHYLPSPEAKVHDLANINMGAHTDYECLTLVHQNAPGLQLLSASGEWCDVPVHPSALFVNIGDLLEVWSNGLLTATLHRVVNRAERRQSLVYFAATDYDVIVSPLEALLTPERPAHYPPIHAGAHLEQMLRRDFPYLRALDAAMGLPSKEPPALSFFERQAERRAHSHKGKGSP